MLEILRKFTGARRNDARSDLPEPSKYSPPARRLFPAEPEQRAEVERLCRRLDERLGPTGRRLMYVNMLAERRLMLRFNNNGVPRWEDQDFVAEVARITGGKLVQVVYDSVGRTTFHKSLECLAPRGTMVLYGQSSGPVEPFDPQLLEAKLDCSVRDRLADGKAEAAAQEQAALERVLQQILDPEARERLTRIRMSRPELADAVTRQLVALAQQGRLARRLSDADLRAILAQVPSDQRDIKITRK